MPSSLLPVYFIIDASMRPLQLRISERFAEEAESEQLPRDTKRLSTVPLVEVQYKQRETVLIVQRTNPPFADSLAHNELTAFI